MRKLMIFAGIIGLIYLFTGNSFAEEALRIIEKGGTERKITNWSFTPTCTYTDLQCVRFHANTEEQQTDIEKTAKSVGVKNPDGSIWYEVPLYYISKIEIGSQTISRHIGARVTETLITYQNGDKKQVNAMSFFISGNEDLGDLGAGKYARGSEEMKEVILPATGYDNPLKASEVKCSGRIIDRSGQLYSVDDIIIVEEHASLTIGIFRYTTPQFIGYKNTNVFTFYKDGTAVDVDRQKISSIDFLSIVTAPMDAVKKTGIVGDAWKVKVILKTGSEYELYFSVLGKVIKGIMKNQFLDFGFDFDNIQRIEFDQACQ